MHIIGFGGESGAGKSTAAGMVGAELLDHGYTVKLEAFFVPGKRYARREQHCQLLDKFRDRPLLQQYRDMLLARAGDKSLLVKDLIHRNNMDAPLWKHFSDPWKPAEFLIIADIRYLDEATFVKDRGVLVFLEGTHRPLAGIEARHDSESHHAEIAAMADFTIAAPKSLEAMAGVMRQFILDGCHIRKGNATT